MDSWGAVIDCVIVNQGEGMLLSEEGGETQENTGGGGYYRLVLQELHRMLK